MTAPASGDGHRNPFLARLRRSGTVGDAELAAMDDLLDGRRPVGARRDLLPEGPHAARLHVLLDGWACRYKLLADGQRQVTALLLPGDVCDLDGLYVLARGYAVGTLTPCTVATLDVAAVRGLARHHPGVAEALGWLATVDNAVLAERVVSLGRRSGRGRVAHLVCELFVRLAATGNTGAAGYTLPMTQADMSDVLGLSTVHVNRVLQGLRAEKLILLKGRELAILDWTGLRTAAEFRPDYLHGGGADGLDVVHGPAAAAPAPGPPGPGTADR